MRILLLSLYLIAVTASPARTYKRTYARKMVTIEAADKENIRIEKVGLEDVKEKTARTTEEKIELQDLKANNSRKMGETENEPLDTKQEKAKKIEDTIESQDVETYNGRTMDEKEPEPLDTKQKNAKKIENKIEPQNLKANKTRKTIEKELESVDIKRNKANMIESKTEHNVKENTEEDSPRALYDQNVSVISSTVATLTDGPQEISPHVISLPQINIGWPQGASTAAPKKGMEENDREKDKTENGNTVNIYINFNDDDDYENEYECRDGSKKINGRCEWGKCKKGEVMFRGVCTSILMPHVVTDGVVDR